VQSLGKITSLVSVRRWFNILMYSEAEIELFLYQCLSISFHKDLMSVGKRSIATGSHDRRLDNSSAACAVILKEI